MLTEYFDIARHRDELEHVLGGLLGQDVYVCLASELGLHVDAAGWSGAVIRGLELLVRESTPERWRGVRPAMALNDGPTGERIELRIRLFDAVAIHELAHLADDRARGRRSVLSETCSDFEPRTRSILERVRIADTGPESVPAWYGHELPFIRALLHCHWRAVRAGLLDLSDADLFPHLVYGLSPLAWYREAFNSECEDREQWPLCDALTGAPPRPASELWTLDTTTRPPDESETISGGPEQPVAALPVGDRTGQETQGPPGEVRTDPYSLEEPSSQQV